MEAIAELPGSEPATPTPSSYDDDKVSRLTLVENMEDEVEEDVDVPPMIGAITLNRKRKSRAIRAYIRRRQLSEDGKGSVIDRDLITALRQLAVSGGGLVRDEHRQVIWPLLGESLEDSHSTGSPSSSSSDERASSESDYESAKSSVADDNDPGTPLIELGEPTVEDLKTHCEWRQVEMDVYRTLTRFPPNISDGHRSILQDELTPLIVRVLWDNPNYRYYQ
uniref:Rab-GAP TBC domain-containing protein n=1 Tax=Plectus sambesii TaxID=2011161 RepID=A0A914W635_9BILA